MERLSLKEARWEVRISQVFGRQETSLALLTARLLASSQECVRKYRLGQPTGRWHPPSLLRATLRASLLPLSQGLPLERVQFQALEAIQKRARDPGLLSASPWECAQDLCGAALTILEALSKPGLPSLAPPPSRPSGFPEWASGAFLGEETLHRWAFVSDFSPSTWAHELHSWQTVGEIAVFSLPMVLHMVSIGKLREGRMRSEWNRAWRQEGALAGRIKFRRKDSSPLQGAWETLSFKPGKSSSAEWVRRMESEGVLSPLLQELRVQRLDSASQERVLQELQAEASRLETLSQDWRLLPMSRNACDARGGCPFQEACYSPFPSVS